MKCVCFGILLLMLFISTLAVDVRKSTLVFVSPSTHAFGVSTSTMNNMVRSKVSLTDCQEKNKRRVDLIEDKNDKNMEIETSKVSKRAPSYVSVPTLTSSLTSINSCTSSNPSSTIHTISTHLISTHLVKLI